MARQVARLAGLLLLTGGLLSGGPPPGRALAAEWGGIEPGVTTVEQVRERYGAPTRETPKKVEGYDTLEWVYEGAHAPAGLVRMMVEFGILIPEGYQPRVVRVFRLDPKPLIFARPTVLEGWGVPDRAGRQDDRDVFLYASGLLVTFDQDGINATSMYFMVPQAAQLGQGTAAPFSEPARGAAPAAAPPSAPAPASPSAPAPAPGR